MLITLRVTKSATRGIPRKQHFRRSQQTSENWNLAGIAARSGLVITMPEVPEQPDFASQLRGDAAPPLPGQPSAGEPGSVMGQPRPGEPQEHHEESRPPSPSVRPLRQSDLPGRRCGRSRGRPPTVSVGRTRRAPPISAIIYAFVFAGPFPGQRFRVVLWGLDASAGPDAARWSPAPPAKFDAREAR